MYVWFIMKTINKSEYFSNLIIIFKCEETNKVKMIQKQFIFPFHAATKTFITLTCTNIKKGIKWKYLSNLIIWMIVLLNFLQVHPVCSQCESQERGELLALPPLAARLRTVPPGGRHVVPEPLTPRRDRVRRPLPPSRSAFKGTCHSVWS